MFQACQGLHPRAGGFSKSITYDHVGYDQILRDSETDAAVFDKTIEELNCGWLAGPFDLENLPDNAVISRRFGIRQSSGEGSKIRLIDDFRPLVLTIRCKWRMLQSCTPWILLQRSAWNCLRCQNKIPGLARPSTLHQHTGNSELRLVL